MLVAQEHGGSLLRTAERASRAVMSMTLSGVAEAVSACMFRSPIRGTSFQGMPLP
jgi:hypothetical protein